MKKLILIAAIFGALTVTKNSNAQVQVGLNINIGSQPEWGPVIVYGAALERFNYTGDNESYDRYYPVFKRFENVALGRTIQQLTEQQSVPRF